MGNSEASPPITFRTLASAPGEDDVEAGRAADVDAGVMWLPVPYTLPPKPYAIGEKPWMVDAAFPGTDTLGCTLQGRRLRHYGNVEPAD